MLTKLLMCLLAGVSICSASESTKRFSSGAAQFTIENPGIVWGHATNFLRGSASGECLPTSLRIGVSVTNGVIVLSGKPLKPRYPARVFIQNHSGPPFWTFPAKHDKGPTARVIPTTNWVFAYMPPIDQSLVVTMTDTNGVAVPKTPAGLATGRQPILKPKVTWYRFTRNNHNRFGLLPMEDYENLGLNPLNPAKYFELESPGAYRLTLALRIFVMETNSFMRTVTLPPATVDVLVEK